MVTLQAFTRGKSFYLGKISLSKFTSGFIFPWSKGHTVQNFGAKMENMLENQTDQRDVYMPFITLFKRARRARVILPQCLISRRIQRRRRAAWVLPRPQYWFETLLHSNALKENLRLSRETFNFICDSTRKFRICHQRDRRRASIGRLLWDLIFPFFCFRVVVKGNPQEILLFSCGFQAPDDKTFPR